MASVGLFSILSTARDGMMASSTALSVTSQNVSGVSTPGYVRRAAKIEGSLTGVRVTGISRAADRFATAQVALQQGRLGAADARASALERASSIVSPTNGTLSDGIDRLLSSFHDLAASPDNAGARAAVLSNADALAHGFADADAQFGALRNELFDQAKSVVTDVNGKLQRLAALDRAAQDGTAHGEDVSSLLDERERTIRDIASSVGARVAMGDDGKVTLFGAGTVLYEGVRARTLSVSADAAGGIVITNDGDASQANLAGGIDGGTLGGILEARERDLPTARAKVTAFASDVAALFNGIHATGVGLDGSTGRALFDPSGMSLDAAMVGHPERLAASSTAAGLPGGNDVALSLAQAGERALAGGGTMTERFAKIAGEIGTLSQSATAERTTREDTLASAEAIQESSSGVSTDEEMIRMQQFQRGFEASMKVLSTINDLFDSLMNL